MTALPIKPVAETADTVTLSRTDFEALTELVADATDLADIEAVKRKIADGETQLFPFEIAERLLDGEHPVRVFRDHRGFGLRQLATSAGISASYLSEIETRQKAGSVDCLRRLADTLEVSLDLLAGRPD
jgi:antitoxin component HigA of HigAB toxin-antitoxin module